MDHKMNPRFSHDEAFTSTGVIPCGPTTPAVTFTPFRRRPAIPAVFRQWPLLFLFPLFLTGCFHSSSFQSPLSSLRLSAEPIIGIPATSGDDASTTLSSSLGLWIRSLDRPRRWTADPSRDSDPDVSPDGRTLAFVSDRQGSEDIYLLSLPPEEPAPPRPLVATPARDSEPRFSPDGRSIAYVSTLEDAFGDIWIANVKTGKTRRLTDRATRDANPTWLPDGKTILFTTAMSDRQPDIAFLNIKSGKIEKRTPPQWLYSASMPDVSSNGRWIAVIEPTKRRLALWNLETGDLLWPTPGDYPEAYPRFERDGRSLLLLRAADDTNADDRNDEFDRRTVWRLEFDDTGSAQAFYPLTTARQDARRAAPHPHGFFYSAATTEANFDLFSFSQHGAIPLRSDLDSPTAESVQTHIDQLREQRPYDDELQIAAWRLVSGRRIPETPPSLQWDALFQEVQLQERLGRLGRAAKTASQVLTLVPDDSEFHDRTVVEQQRIAISRVDRATAQVERQTASRREALRQLESLCSRRSPNDPVAAEARLLMAVIYSDLNEIDRAIAVTDSLLSFSPIQKEYLWKFRFCL